MSLKEALILAEITMSIKIGDTLWGRYDDLPYIVSDIVDEGLYDGKHLFTVVMVGRDDSAKRDHIRTYGERISESEIRAFSSI